MNSTIPNQMTATMREILQQDYLSYRVLSYTLREDLTRGISRISCELEEQTGGEKLGVEGEGLGMIDALFHALKRSFSETYASLEHIRFSEFRVEGLMERLTDAPEASGTAAKAQATVGITNSEGREFMFQATAPSVSQSGIEATLAATEYFVNSERTFVKLQGIIAHYKETHQMDLVQKYTSLMVEVVKNTSYSGVVEKLREAERRELGLW